MFTLAVLCMWNGVMHLSERTGGTCQKAGFQDFLGLKERQEASLCKFGCKRSATWADEILEELSGANRI